VRRVALKAIKPGMDTREVLARFEDERQALALMDHPNTSRVFAAMANLDELYPQPSGESALQQLQVQLAHPLPCDLDETNLAEDRRLDPKWQDWQRVSQRCASIAADIFRRL